MNLQTYRNEILQPALFYSANAEPGDPFWMMSDSAKEAALARMLRWLHAYRTQAFIAWATGDSDVEDAFSDRIIDLLHAIDLMDLWLRRED
jgi:hypothetical protein